MKENLTITLKSPGSSASQPAPVPTPTPKKKRRWFKRLMQLFVLLLVIGAVFAACFYGYNKYKESNGTANTNSPADVVAEVGKLMLLPNETPTVAVVSDLSKLQGQKFFANAHEGDVVLMYANAQEAILYSPSKKMIIQVAPITNQQPN